MPTLRELTEFYNPKSAAKRRLVQVLFNAQSKGWEFYQSTGQLHIEIRQEVSPPQWAIDRDPYYKGRTITRIVELCLTGRDSLSILQRVYHGSCYNQDEYSKVSMKAAVATLTAEDPWAQPVTHR